MEILGSSKILLDETTEAYNSVRERYKMSQVQHISYRYSWLNERDFYSFSSLVRLFHSISTLFYLHRNSYMGINTYRNSVLCTRTVHFGLCSLASTKCWAFVRMNSSYIQIVVLGTTHEKYTNTHTHLQMPIAYSSGAIVGAVVQFDHTKRFIILLQGLSVFLFLFSFIVRCKDSIWA